MSMNIQGNSNSYIRLILWNMNGRQNLAKLKKGLLYLKSRQVDAFTGDSHEKLKCHKTSKGLGGPCLP